MYYSFDFVESAAIVKTSKRREFHNLPPLHSQCCVIVRVCMYVCMNLAETVRFFIGVFAWIP